MNCLNPIVLKNGLTVPCGRCELCRSDARNEWSIRLAIHLESCQRMPMFITLTYDDKHLHWESDLDIPDAVFPSLYRPHVSRFIKAYKRKYDLKDDDFQYFGCGEYGSSENCTHRPHYHLLFFGDNELYDDFCESMQKACERIKSVWTLGFVHVGIAGYDGIHYVTKYVLKDDWNQLPDVCIKPFTIASNGLGMNFLNSKIGKAIKRQLIYLYDQLPNIYCNMPDILDDSCLKDAIDYLGSFIPNFQVILSDGRKVFLPRAIRRKLIGSFEHFKDNPLWLYNHLKQLYDSIRYYDQFKDYDMDHELSISYQKCLNRVEKINKRLKEKKFNSLF